MPSAKSPGIDDSPTIHIIPPGNIPGGDDLGQTGEDDEGDGDDLAGIKGRTRPTGGGGPLGAASSFYPNGSAAKVWWMYFLYHVRVMF
jgi:hypothetical protein